MEKHITANRTHHITSTLITAITIMIQLSPSVLSTSIRNLPLPPQARPISNLPIVCFSSIRSVYDLSSSPPSPSIITIDHHNHHRSSHSPSPSNSRYSILSVAATASGRRATVGPSSGPRTRVVASDPLRELRAVAAIHSTPRHHDRW